ncbi:MAG: hypothetical protein RL154_1434 [Pseudomonadota bacterium]|jgi:hypothetical protein
MALAMVNNHVINVKSPEISTKVHKKLEDTPVAYEAIKKAMSFNFVVKDGKQFGF